MKTFKRIANILFVAVILFSFSAPNDIAAAPISDNTEEAETQRFAPDEAPIELKQSMNIETQAAFTSCADVTEIPQSECEALVALYNSTDGDNWYTNTD